MKHLSAENIVDYMDGRASDVDKSTFEAHLASCQECSGLRQEFQDLTEHMREDASYEPPDAVLEQGISVFQPVMQPEAGGLRKIIATLVFDTFDQPMLAGVRRVGVPPRQLLFRAGDVDVDVKIESMEANETFCVPETMVGRGGNHYVLRVRGNSMVDEHIRDGDFVVVNERQRADNGEMVIALLNGSDVTLKKFYREHGHIRLQPANPAMQPIIVQADQVQVQGVVIGVMRRY